MGATHSQRKLPGALMQSAFSPHGCEPSAARHSSMSTHVAPCAVNPLLHAHTPSPATHSALLVQSKSELQAVRTWAGSQAKRPSPWYPAGHAQ